VDADLLVLVGLTTDLVELLELRRPGLLIFQR
jgi:hypothetical protein